MLKTTYDAYRGELCGVALFKAFHDKSCVAIERGKWQMLTQLESHVATLLRNYLMKNGQVFAEVDSEMNIKGQQAAAAWLEMEWSQLMAALEPWIEAYAIKYRKIADESPSDQHNIYNMIATHEEAIFYFVRAERAGDEDSLKAVREFMINFPNNEVSSSNV